MHRVYIGISMVPKEEAEMTMMGEKGAAAGVVGVVVPVVVEAGEVVVPAAGGEETEMEAAEGSLAVAAGAALLPAVEVVHLHLLVVEIIMTPTTVSSQICQI